MELPAAEARLPAGEVTEEHVTEMQHIPVPLMLAMQLRYGLRQFVETGTFHGASTLLAIPHFDLVTTCDIYERYVAPFRGLRIGSGRKLVAICGSSPDVLARVFGPPDCPPALVWLDAHWCGGPLLGPECPLLDELRAIGGTRGRHVILIDDARLFINKPPPPHDPSKWPTMREITDLCGQLGPDDVVEVVGDVVVVRPNHGEHLKWKNKDCKT